jgi:HD-like signal output (HDOD) protein/CheY-like chemotaxis protein
MIRILFVDDEPNVLQAMRRSLHGMRSEWSMEFAPSGAAALEMLMKTPPDVVVSDMRMPGMDGWELLAEVKKLQPQTVRLILSGHADPVSIMRAVGAAHQYLAKPCESATLKAAIARTQALRALLSDDRMALLVGRVDSLPSAPKAFQELLACLQDPGASLADAARIIARDVAMTANIMKLVNSAFFGSRQPIATADRAVAYLGMDTLGALVLGHSVFQSGATTDNNNGIDLEQLWRHSLQTGAAARTIALVEGFSAAQAEEAFLAGMLHDVGQIVFATRAVAAADDPSAPSEDAATHLLAHHAEVGGYLLGLWGFQTPIVEAVAFHDAPSRATGPGLGLPGVVHVANQMMHHQDAQTQGGTDDLDIEPGYLERLELLDHLPRWSAALDALDSEQSTQ